jgi:hypothetical protein
MGRQDFVQMNPQLFFLIILQRFGTLFSPLQVEVIFYFISFYYLCFDLKRGI